MPLLFLCTFLVMREREIRLKFESACNVLCGSWPCHIPGALARLKAPPWSVSHLHNSLVSLVASLPFMDYPFLPSVSPGSICLQAPGGGSESSKTQSWD